MKLWRKLPFIVFVLIGIVIAITKFSDSVFVNKEYSHQIEIKIYSGNLKYLYGILQEKQNEDYVSFNNKSNYLLVKLRNYGEKRAWGKLNVMSSQRKLAVILVNSLEGLSDEYFIYLVPIASADVKPESNISFEWEELFTK
ncbi:hypothetical protein [Litoribacillus peritrichatus]|uniref:Uncharacterized protein n=1 Tax=Litoribacillus peritrichatus TaxID=718191 RepID=A0ABP7MKD2_9GAMM